jgi:hypothetical protein
MRRWDNEIFSSNFFIKTTTLLQLIVFNLVKKTDQITESVRHRSSTDNKIILKTYFVYKCLKLCKELNKKQLYL